jgi:hypothetical protein
MSNTKKSAVNRSVLALLFGAMSLMSLGSCVGSGRAESAGEKVDEAANDAARAIEDAGD